MKILIIDECYYTRLGITEYLSKNDSLKFVSVNNITDATAYVKNDNPTIILVNLTYYCHHSDFCPRLQSLFKVAQNTRFYIYIDAPYPFTDKPVLLKDNFFLMSKNIIEKTLDKLIFDSSQIEHITQLTHELNSSVFSYQEQCIINSWMNEIPNHVISKRLGISNSTVYSHKRHITAKVFVKNRIELFFIYNIFKYLY
ncbi:LuxR C-terminal-related transcriptional regulator [Moellerella wisconsensis]|uniref:LuxR C-terminal-related transcriptional regulator n=1 Tax=Moellerella wisconsensis TaxID=158849 RepID=UPI001F4DA411|nr:LuxR C-terminal-related transcriptional regulator [Moellerella wisconsensis]UNH43477.1 LuxR C-terminal-related transcriptional regulator [Moellerella wisconsensis]